jgi:hypothetical protein
MEKERSQDKLETALLVSTRGKLISNSTAQHSIPFRSLSLLLMSFFVSSFLDFSGVSKDKSLSCSALLGGM